MTIVDNIDFSYKLHKGREGKLTEFKGRALAWYMYVQQKSQTRAETAVFHIEGIYTVMSRPVRLTNQNQDFNELAILRIYFYLILL